MKSAPWCHVIRDALIDWYFHDATGARRIAPGRLLKCSEISIEFTAIWHYNGFYIEAREVRTWTRNNSMNSNVPYAVNR
jgi:hypothetical protein